MILTDFYKIHERRLSADGKHLLDISLNPNHPIFNGHFPNRPVTPGVCMLQIVKSISEDLLQAKLRMTAAKNIRFYAIIDPFVHPDLSLEVEIKEADAIQVKANCSFDETIALKMELFFHRYTHSI